MRHCNNCNGGILCITCNIQVNENKDFEANLNLLKRHVPIELGQMHPYYEE